MRVEALRVRNPRGEGDRLRDEILAAAFGLVDAGEPLTLRAVARRAGITAPSIYPHFDGLDAVRDAVLARSFADLDATVAAAIDGADGPIERLQAGCLAYVGYGWEHRPRFTTMFAAGGFAPDAVATLDRIAHAVGACADAGIAMPGDARETAFLLWAGLHGMATLEKPARADLRRLGSLDRVALTGELVRRLARLR